MSHARRHARNARTPRGALTAHRIDGLFGVGSFISQRSEDVSRLVLGRTTLLRASWIREEFTATRLHSSPGGRYAWASFDRVVAAERRAGFQILGLLDYSNTWTFGDHGSMPHTALRTLTADFARYAYAVVRHYRGKIRYWQVWNEPDRAIFWHPVPNATDYATLLTATSRAIHRANSSSRVVLAGTSGMNLQFVRTVAQHTRSFDVVAVHPYRNVPENGLLDQVRLLRAWGKPVWFTEIGWAAGEGCDLCSTEETQANYLVRFYALAAAAGVQRIFWYDLRDDRYIPANPEGHFGLLRYDLSAKPAFSAYAYLAHALRRAAFQYADVLGTGGTYILRFRTSNGPFVVAWNSSGRTSTTVRWNGADAEVLRADGSLLGRYRAYGRVVAVPLSSAGAPVYLVQRRPFAAIGEPGALLRIVPTAVPTPAPRPRSHPRPTPTVVTRGAWAVSTIKPSPRRRRRKRHDRPLAHATATPADATTTVTAVGAASS